MFFNLFKNNTVWISFNIYVIFLYLHSVLNKISPSMCVFLKKRKTQCGYLLTCMIFYVYRVFKFPLHVFVFFSFIFNLFYLWLCLILLLCKLFLVAVSGGSSAAVLGFTLQWLLLLRNTESRACRVQWLQHIDQ